MDNVRFYSIREFYNKHNNDAVACNWNNNGIVIPCVRFGNALVPISKECQGASGKEIFKNPENYSIVEFVEGEDKSKKYRIIPIDCTNKYSLPEKNEIELLIEDAMSLLRQGIDGNRVYQPLFKAWKKAIQSPHLLNGIQNNALVGEGFLTLISYGTILALNELTQVASLAYLYISKAIIQNDNQNDYKNRLLLFNNYHNEYAKNYCNVAGALQYMITNAIIEWMKPNSLPEDVFFDMLEKNPAFYSMEYYDLSNLNYTNNQVNLFFNRKKDIESRIDSGDLFSSNDTVMSVIQKGKENHEIVLSYLENKILKDLDLEF